MPRSGRAGRLTPTEFGGRLTSNVRYFRYGEHPGRLSSSDPEKFLRSEFSVRLRTERPATHYRTRLLEATHRP
jgi:hypothetical protein